MKEIASRLNEFKDSIFGVISALARDYDAVNLGQGFPDFDAPEFLKKIAEQKIHEGHNQYAPFHGTSNLRAEISSYYERFYGLKYDTEKEISVTVGGTEAIYCALMALVNPGEEVIVLEPFYDSYVAAAKMAGGVVVPVTLHGPNFELNLDELKAAITPKTKMIIVNNPHNPSGKVWEKEELESVAKLAIEHDLYVMSDEVYEFLLFDGAKHIPMATLEDIRERVITISSAAKTFGVTGWKIGWICASPEVSRACRLVHQYITFAVATPLQEAIAVGLKNLETYIPEFQETYQKKRDYFYKELTDLGFEFPKPRGSFFMMVPIKDKTDLNDVDYAMKLIRDHKVAAVPPSAFYLKSTEGEGYLRFCFAKKDETLKLAVQNLQGL
ncbi:MAG TPA: methionine aminotransferase [Bacteriovoracaceae bacterium]|nr:methionine aminotransferase [Bacteriovoracaceae bacterium]